jgi:hypothetical protein
MKAQGKTTSADLTAEAERKARAWRQDGAATAQFFRAAARARRGA